MSHLQNKKIPPEKAAEIERLKAECEKFERKGLFDTAHHTMLKRLLEEDKSEVKHGESSQ